MDRESRGSNRILAEIVDDRLAGADEVLVVDLHTGHGEYGTVTTLSHVPEDHPDVAWLRGVFGSGRTAGRSVLEAAHAAVGGDTTSSPR